MQRIIIYTDGGCRNNPGVGGWGVWLQYAEHDKKIKGAKALTTNNQMELTAAIKALEALNDKTIGVDLYTDSKYVLNGINEWIISWRANNWRTSSKKPVKNKALWQSLDALNQYYDVNWHWVKGHSDDPGNDMADALANEAMDALVRRKQAS